MKSARPDLSAPLQRRDLIAVLTYVNHGRNRKSVDGSFAHPEAYLDRLAAASGMQ